MKNEETKLSQVRAFDSSFFILPSSFPVKLAPPEALLLNEFVLHADANESGRRNSWFWIPSLYLAEGLPNAIVTTVSIVFYKALGVSNTWVGIYTGLFYLPWVIKPLWSPVVDVLRTRRWWIWRTQLLLAVVFGVLALTLSAHWFIPGSIVCFFLIAFNSATHDIAADGFYIVALAEAQQSFFSGIRNTAFRA